MTTNILTQTQYKASGRSMISRLILAFEVKSQRAKLASLDYNALRDIGVDEAARDTEVNRHFWDF